MKDNSIITRINRIRFDLISSKDEKRRKQIRLNEYDYPLQIKNAIKHTKKLNLGVPQFDFTPEEFIYSTDEFAKDLKLALYYEFRNWTVNDFSFNCLVASINAQNIIKNRLGVNTLITLGSYSEEGEAKIFYESFRKQKFRLKHPNYNSSEVMIHCWLTLPDYKIIDVSLLSSLRLYKNYSDDVCRQFLFSDGKIQKKGDFNFYFHPQLVGEGYFEKIELKSKAD